MKAKRKRAGRVAEAPAAYGTPGGGIVLYRAPDGTVSLDVRLERETIWLSQRQMAELFDKDSDTVGLHIRNVFSEGELDEPATTEESSVVRREGSRDVARTVRFFNGEERGAVSSRRRQADCRQRAGGNDLADRRESPRRERHPHASGGEPDRQTELLIMTESLTAE